MNENGGSSRDVSDAIDLVVLSQLVALARKSGSVNLVTELVDGFNQLAPLILHDIRTASGRGEFKTVEAHAHRLAGSSGNIGLRRVFERSLDVEAAAQREDPHLGIAIEHLEECVRKDVVLLSAAITSTRS